MDDDEQGYSAFLLQGRQVRAKSGELEMLVVGWDGEHVVCEWVEREVVIERELFLPEELVLVRKA